MIFFFVVLKGGGSILAIYVLVVFVGDWTDRSDLIICFDWISFIFSFVFDLFVNSFR
jgi:hypothetical protein